MASEKDASKQVSHQANLGEPGCSLSTLQLRFCNHLFCLSDIWHEWGCCSSELATLAPALNFDHVGDDFLDGFGYDSNAFFHTNEVGGIAQQLLLQSQM